MTSCGRYRQHSPPLSPRPSLPITNPPPQKISLPLPLPITTPTPSSEYHSRTQFLCSFSDNHATAMINGGAIMLLASLIDMTSCKFESNYGMVGGAIYAQVRRAVTKPRRNCKSGCRPSVHRLTMVSYLNPPILMCVSSHIHTYIHTYIYTYIHTYIHTYMCIARVDRWLVTYRQLMVVCGRRAAAEYRAAQDILA